MVISPDSYLISESGEYVWSQDRVRGAWLQTYRAYQRALQSGRFKKAVLMVGIPASGKSTWLTAHHEPDVLYVDATFAGHQARYPFIGWASEAGVPIEAVVMDTPIAVCLERNGCRPENRRVPDESLTRMALRLQGDMPTGAEGFSRVVHVRGPDPVRVARRYLARVEVTDAFRKAVKVTRMTPGAVDEWATLTVEVTGPWDKPRSEAEEERLKDRILEAVMDTPSWNSWIGRARSWKVSVVDTSLQDEADSYADDYGGDEDERENAREQYIDSHPTMLHVPIPRRPDDFEEWDVGDGVATFSLSDREDG